MRAVQMLFACSSFKTAVKSVQVQMNCFCYCARVTKSIGISLNCDIPQRKYLFMLFSDNIFTKTVFGTKIITQ